MNSFFNIRAALLALAVLPAAVQSQPISFKADIAPILVQKCQSCHGPKKAKGKYRLDTFNRALMPGSDELLFRVSTDDEDERMPPEGDPLSPAQVALFKKWTSEGAKFDDADPDSPLASILPSLEHPPAPETYSRPIPISALAFQHDGQTLAVAGYREILLRKVQDGSLVRRIGNLPEKIHAIDFSADGKWIAVAGGIPGRLGEVRVMEAASGKILKVLHKSEDLCFAAVFSPDGSKLATGGADGTVRIYDVPKWSQSIVFSNHSDWVNHVAWHPDGSMVASASRDHTAKVFDLAERKRLSSYTGHNASIYAVQFHPESPDVFSGAGDGRLMRWRIKDAGTVREYLRHPEAVFHLQTNPALKQLLTAGGDTFVTTLHWHDPGRRKNYETGKQASLCVAVSPNGALMASGDRAGMLRVWDVNSGERTLECPGVVLAQ